MNKYFPIKYDGKENPKVEKTYLNDKHKRNKQTLKTVIIIPVRYDSSRLPGKPLEILEGKSMIQRTYERCIKSLPKKDVYIATDSFKIKEHCEQFKAKIIMTSISCLTGTDRIAEASKKIECDVVINVQGDEPIINPKDIKKVIDAAKKYPGEIINGMSIINNKDEFFNPSIPKVIARSDGKLLYMSRGGIPTTKKLDFTSAWKQICIYAFPINCLKTFSKKKNKTPLEQIEDIEILRFLEIGYDVRMVELSGSSFAVDTPTDLENVRKYLINNNK